MLLSKACQDISKNNKDILSVILMGSRARGDFNENSDYDLMFITKRGKKYELERNYENLIYKKTKIKNSIDIHLWPINRFKEEYKKGNSFIYCALRDGKKLYFKLSLDLDLPSCKIAGKERINLAKENLNFLRFHLKFMEKKHRINKRFFGLELEELGYCAMHLCWAVCMLNNFCPISKYTVLNESKKYFTKKEFEIIKRTYQFYSNPDFYRKTNRKSFFKFFRALGKMIKRIDLESK